MSAHPPPVPPEQRPPHGPAAADVSQTGVSETGAGNARTGNTAERGQSGNVHQNTTNKGLQQDR